VNDSLFSDSWYRVASLRPRLRNHAQVHRHTYRGAVWYVLQDNASGRFHRFTPVANAVIGLMDGKRSVQEIWDLACVQLGDAVPSQDEIIKLISDLHRADVLQSDAPPDLEEIQRRRKQHWRTRFKQYFGNPMSLRFPLYDPDALLQRMMPFARPLFGWFGLLLWLATLAAAGLLAAMHWPAFSDGMLDHVFSVDNLLVMWLVFPLVKVLHEFGHGLAVKARGGQVHEMGVMLLLLMPVPYVDASFAAAFEDKRWRMLVGAAGMLTELFIAALAMIAWVWLEPGFERAIAYNVILITGVSTLLFNGNPFLRYDGYYILSDWLEIPNLGQRSNEYLGYLINRYLFGVPDMKSPVVARGEARWFVFYSITSFAYRMFMMVTIVLVVASRFFLFGLLMAVWSVFTMLLMPVFKNVKYLANSPRLHTRRGRALAISVAAAGSALLLLFVLPAPSYTHAQGVVWAPEEAQVRANVDGFVAEVAARAGAGVARGQLLVRSEDPVLRAREAVAAAALVELEARRDAAMVASRVQADILEQQIAHARVTLADARKRLQEMQIAAPSDGTFVLADELNMQGRFVQRGELLGFVTGGELRTVRVVVAQAYADLVREDTAAVRVRASERLDRTLDARVLRALPGATEQLPSMTLSMQGGGEIALDPRAPEEGRALEKLFVVDLEVPPGSGLSLLGSRVHVRFEHTPEPLAWQWYRGARRIFMKKFSV
jgi:putative peptide zinc metalloprotease protein